MNFTVLYKLLQRAAVLQNTTQIWKVMKLVTILLFAACMQVGAKTYSQITLSLKNAPLKTVFIQINEQTGFKYKGERE